jgi:hypothetical protein
MFHVGNDLLKGLLSFLAGLPIYIDRRYFFGPPEYVLAIAI